MNRKLNYYTSEIQRRCGNYLYIDHSFKVVQHIQHFGHSKLFNGLFSGLNEYGEIRVFQFVHSAGFEEIRDTLKNFYKTSQAYKRVPAHIWTDNCCHDREFLMDSIPSLQENLLVMKKLPLPAVFQTLTDINSIETALKGILAALDKSHESVLMGLDCEWSLIPAKTGARVIYERPIGLIQLAMEFPWQKIFLIRVVDFLRSRVLPSALKDILEHPKVHFAGNKVEVDVQFLQRDFNLKMSSENLIRLNHLCYEKGFFPAKNSSLENQCSKVLGFLLPKDKDVRCSNWSNNTRLTAKQIEYAARDVWASYLIAKKLQDYTRATPAGFTPSPLDFPTSATREGGEIHQTVHLDVFHAMDRILRKTSSKHPAHFEFSKSLQIGFFDYDVKAKEKVVEVLNKDNVTFEEKLNFDSDYILKRVPRVVPAPEILAPRLDDLLQRYSHEVYTDQRHGPLINDGCKKAFLDLKKHVENWCLSDPPGVQLYVRKHKDLNGLDLYRCLRGTNTVELWHQFLEMRFASWNAGIEFAWAALMILVDRRNKRASERNRESFPKLGHYEHQLIDHIQTLHENIHGKKKYTWWSPVSELKVARERFGVVPILPINEQQNIQPKDVEGFSDNMKFLARMTNTPVPYIGFSSKVENLLFSNTVSHYVSNSKLDSDNMANDWNSGKLHFPTLGFKEEFLKFISNRAISKIAHTHLIPKGTNSIWKKLAEHMEKYYNLTYLRSGRAKNMKHRALQTNLSPLQLNFTDDVPSPLNPEQIPSQITAAIGVMDPDFDPDELPSPNSNFKFKTFLANFAFLVLNRERADHFLGNIYGSTTLFPNVMSTNSVITAVEASSMAGTTILAAEPIARLKKKCKVCYEDFKNSMNEEEAVRKARDECNGGVYNHKCIRVCQICYETFSKKAEEDGIERKTAKKDAIQKAREECNGHGGQLQQGG